jgi:hypothetical protein
MLHGRFLTFNNKFTYFVFKHFVFTLAKPCFKLNYLDNYLSVLITRIPIVNKQKIYKYYL